MICSICSSSISEPVQELFALPTVTSDCRPYKSGRSVEICSGCGVMHRVTNADFSDVYDGYVSYPEPTGRTAKILDFVKDKMPEPKSVLDMGCGQGLGLDILKEKFPLASVQGYDPYSSSYQEQPNGKYDLITLFHVLEHVEDLHEMLAYIKSSLTDNGHVLIQVPYTTMWPFDLILADHWWHFNPFSLRELFHNAGFGVICMDNGVIAKEITLLASTRVGSGMVLNEKWRNKETIDWLLSYKQHLENLKQTNYPAQFNCVVYGTGPAAAWAGNILGECGVIHYCDDDFERQGKPFNRKTVSSPSYYNDSVNKWLPIIAPFPDWQLSAIKAKHPNLRFL